MGSVPVDTYHEILAAHGHMHQLLWEHWWQYELFTPQWWLQLAVIIVPWFVWWRLVDKSRLTTVVCFGFYISFVVIALDAIGVAQQAWFYPIKLLPVIPHAVPLDWSLLPVMHMFTYQYFPRWRHFLIAETALAVALAFGGEPLATWLGVYKPLYWYHHWSVPLYIAKALPGKWLVDRMAARQAAAQAGGGGKGR